MKISVKNCVCSDCTTNFDTSSYYTADSDYNASSDTSAPGSNSVHDIVAADNFVNPGSDFHIKDENADICNAGMDLLTDPNYPISVDIHGTTRPKGPEWDIGADEFLMTTEIIHTVGVSGCDYSLLSAWESDNNRDLATADEIATAECYNNGLMTDSVTLFGWTTDADHYIKIYAPAGQRHNGTKDSGFTVTTSTATHACQIKQQHVRIEGIAFKVHSDSAFAKGIHIDSQDNSDIQISHCLFYGEPASEPSNSKGIHMYYGSGMKIWNNFFFGIGKGIHSEGADDVNIEHNTAFDCYMCYQLSSSSLNNVFINNIGFAWGTSPFYQKGYCGAGSDYNIDNTTNASYQAPGSNSLHNKTPADNIVDTTRGDSDLHLRADAPDALDAGTVALNLTIPDDIDGTERPQGLARDIGGDEYALGPHVIYGIDVYLTAPTMLLSHGIDTVISTRYTTTMGIDALLQVVAERAVTIDAQVSPIIRKTIDAMVQFSAEQGISIDAALVDRTFKNVSADALVVERIEKGTFIDTLVKRIVEYNIAVDAMVVERKELPKSFDVMLICRQQANVTLNALVKTIVEQGITINAEVVQRFLSAMSINATVQEAREIATTIDAIVQMTVEQGITLDAEVVQRLLSSMSINATVVEIQALTPAIDAIVLATVDRNFAIDAHVRAMTDLPFSIDAIVRLAEMHTLYADPDYTQPFTVDQTLYRPIGKGYTFTQVTNSFDMHVYYRNDTDATLQNVTIRPVERFSEQAGEQSGWWKVAKTQGELDGVSPGAPLLLGDFNLLETSDFWIRITIPVEQSIGFYSDVVLRIESVIP